jgi:hypothetical protein
VVAVGGRVGLAVLPAALESWWLLLPERKCRFPIVGNAMLGRQLHAMLGRAEEDKVIVRMYIRALCGAQRRTVIEHNDRWPSRNGCEKVMMLAGALDVPWSGRSL